MQDIVKAIKEATEQKRELILDTLNTIWKNPETGYREWNTSKYLENVFEGLGYDLVKAQDIPGFYTVLDTGRPGPEVLVLGELDSVLCDTHPDANPETGAVHSCGHCAQCAALVGVAGALKDERILSGLSGRIRLCAVPAEELLELAYRTSLRDKGIIKYLGGKQEFIRRGYFDGVDLAFMVHTNDTPDFSIHTGSVGCIVKSVTYKGKAAHAGGAPWNGCNALYAANQGLSAINAIRETFKEADITRVHPIITNGGGAVNAIPDEVTIESYVRGSNWDAIFENNKKVNRALIGGALSLGANIDICDMPGYSPFTNSSLLAEVAADAIKAVKSDVKFERRNSICSGSTDIGDLGCLMPVIHPYVPGGSGTEHGKDYYITDPESACVTSAQWQLAMLYLLLSDGGSRAKAIADDYAPAFKNTDEYVRFMDSIISSGDRITYKGDAAEVRL